MASIQEQARKVGLPVFPIAIALEDGKWTKRPLTPNGHKNASLDVGKFSWSRANGFGIPMGGGLYALDLDEHKDGAVITHWLGHWDVPTKTRTHRTVSGGRHLIYKLPEVHWNLRTRQNVVLGLDTRGAGGWIAFGKGYTVEDDRDPCELPLHVCEELHRDAPTEGLSGVRPPRYVDQDDLTDKLERMLRMSPRLALRWAGHTEGLTDASRSGLDMSVAQLLTMNGFTYDEVVNLLLYDYEHGQAGSGKFDTHASERAACRCAARAEAAKEKRDRAGLAALAQEPTGPSDAQVAAAMDVFKNKPTPSLLQRAALNTAFKRGRKNDR